MSARIRVRALAVVVAAAAALAGCGNSGGTRAVSVFAVHPGECFTTPKTVQAELSSITRTPCTKPHTKEAYAVVPFTAGGISISSTAALSAYPGDAELTTFAQGACAQRFGTYVGVDYLDSALFFTFLLPSARSWEEDADRNVVCFVTTTGGVLTSSVKGSRR